MFSTSEKNNHEIWACRGYADGQSVWRELVCLFVCCWRCSYSVSHYGCLNLMFACKFSNKETEIRGWQRSVVCGGSNKEQEKIQFTPPFVVEDDFQ